MKRKPWIGEKLTCDGIIVMAKRSDGSFFFIYCGSHADVVALRMPHSPQKHNPRGKLAQALARYAYDRDRGNSAQRGYGHKWRRYRIAFLREHPLCVDCEREGRVTAATVVDHIEPHRGDERLFWQESNHQPLCERHHNAKTARGK